MLLESEVAVIFLSSFFVPALANIKNRIGSNL